MANSSKVLELRVELTQDDYAKGIAWYWEQWDNQRATKRAQWQELKEYLFATDTSTTSNSTLPWSNKTTTPKLCQLRDNLHSNYISAIFPNDKWLQWYAYTQEDAHHEKARTITAYMDNKTRQGNFRTRVSRFLLDYIDYGNVFAAAGYENRYSINPETEAMEIEFVGPTAERISPEDIVFNPLANDFYSSPKIIRSVKTIGELIRLSQTDPNQAFWAKAVEKRLNMRSKYGAYKAEDWAKAQQYSVDGFGNLYEYYMSDYVEILEFYGDFHVEGSPEVETCRQITVVDRCHTVRNERINTFSGRAPIYHCAWRLRPDNLWGMGPLDNLVGMQYRIDHLENLKADAMDLTVWPPLEIKGEVEQFVWAPGAEIHTDENGGVQEIAKNLNGIIAADNQIRELEDKMELYAGAPREAMGLRTPGEKTAFEVGQLMTAAGRIFQEKCTSFEINLLEPLLNGMLEQAVYNFDGADIIRVMDTDLGVAQFKEITKDDITAKGILRPVGARHFTQQQQELQNLTGLSQTPIWQQIAPHTSSIGLARFVEDFLSLNAYKIFRPNVAIMEAKETQALSGQAMEDNTAEVMAPGEADAPDLPPPDASDDGSVQNSNSQPSGGRFEDIVA